MKAVYAVLFRVEEDTEIKVGTLGELVFPAGNYVYVGSAMNGVGKRIERHFSESKTDHWHIDYFSHSAEPFDYFVLPENSDYECVLADAVSSFGKPVDGFGCSDCECASHLFRIYNSDL